MTPSTTGSLWYCGECDITLDTCNYDFSGQAECARCGNPVILSEDIQPDDVEVKDPGLPVGVGDEDVDALWGEFEERYGRD